MRADEGRTERNRRVAAGPAPAALGCGEGERKEGRSSVVDGREEEKDAIKTYGDSSSSKRLMP